MPDRLISVFGTYDFLGKSLPGMTLVIGVSALFPTEAIPLPEDVSISFLLLLSALLIVGLIGTLLGEFVHSLADIFENIVGWFARRIWRVWLALRNQLPINSDKEPSPPLGIKMNQDKRDVDENVNSDRRIQEDNSIFQRVWSEFTVLIRSLMNQFQQWRSNQISKAAHIFWSHRKVFSRKLDVIGKDDFRMDASLDDADFAEEYFIKEIVINRYNAYNTSDIDRVYQVVVSELTEADYNRAFRFQARYSFCRSMWLVLFSLAVAYLLTTVSPPGFIPNQLMTGDSFVAGLDSVTRTALGVALLIISVIFMFASGSYKKHYIEYLISEMYANSKNNDVSGEGREIVRKAS